MTKKTKMTRMRYYLSGIYKGQGPNANCAKKRLAPKDASAANPIEQPLVARNLAEHSRKDVPTKFRARRTDLPIRIDAVVKNPGFALPVSD